MSDFGFRPVSELEYEIGQLRAQLAAAKEKYDALRETLNPDSIGFALANMLADTEDQLAAAEQRAKEAFDLMAQERDNFVKAGQQMRADTIEECALWCEEVGRAGKHDKRDSWAGNCASAIRQLAKSERTDQ